MFKFSDENFIYKAVSSLGTFLFLPDRNIKENWVSSEKQIAPKNILLLHINSGANVKMKLSESWKNSYAWALLVIKGKNTSKTVLLTSFGPEVYILIWKGQLGCLKFMLLKTD